MKLRVQFRDLFGQQYAFLKPFQTVLSTPLGQYVAIELRPSDLPLDFNRLTDWVNCSVRTHMDPHGHIELRMVPRVI